MALQSLVLASFLLLASAEVAFVQPSLQSTPPSRGVQQFASTHDATMSSAEEDASPETAPSWSSLLFGAALGLIVSLGGSMSASALYIPERGDKPSNWLTNGDLGLKKDNPLGFRGVPEDCSLRTYNKTASTPSDQFYLRDLGRQWLTAKSKDANLKWYPTFPDKLAKCMNKEQTTVTNQVTKFQTTGFNGKSPDGKIFDAKYAKSTTGKDQDEKNPGELYGARYGINRVGMGHPGVGRKTVSGSGTFEGGGGGEIWTKWAPQRKLGGDGRWNNSNFDGRPYADMLRPGLGKENAALRAYAEGQGLASNLGNGQRVPTAVGWTAQYGNSRTLLDMPFYKAKTAS